MKLKHLIPMMALAIPMIAGAVPAKPGIHQTVNPDGTKINVQCFGDEHFSYYTDAEGKKLLEMTKDGYMIPMVRNGVALEATSENIHALYEEAIAAEQAVSPTRNEVKFKRAALDSQGRTTFPSKGKMKGLVILVEFSDRKFSIPNPKEQFAKMLNQEGYSDYNGMGSAADYYKEGSDGQYQPEFDVYGPYTLSKEAGYYTGYDLIGKSSDASVGKYYRMRELVKEATQGLDSQINYADYDKDENGEIDFIFFFFAGHGQADYYGENGVYEYPKQTCIWPHASSYGSTLTLDNKRMGAYACSMELDGSLSKIANRWMTGIGTFCHEFGHVMGLPDAYDAGGTNSPNPGNYSVMAGGGYNIHSTCPVGFSSYERWLFGWLEYNELEEDGHYELQALASKPDDSDLGKPDKRMVRLSAKYDTGNGTLMKRQNEYFILENRSKVGFDYSIPQDGMLVWHIDYVASRWTSNRVNYNGQSLYMMYGPAPGFIAWPNGGVNYMTPEENVIVENADNPCVFNDFITDITFDKANNLITFDYNKISEYPTLKTNMKNAWLPDPSERAFKVSWEEHPDADAYLVSVYYVNDAGTKIFMNGYNETNVGKDTEIYLRNLSKTQFGREIHAFVRCHNVLPSKEVSDELVFTPDTDLDENGFITGVGTITTDSAIYAGQGHIVAPEGAQVYNMSGMKVGKDNLPSGIYVVRYEQKAVKVFVK